MSDEKNLSDDLNEKLDDAKENVKKAADKVEDKAKDFAKEAKESTKEFADDVKEKAKGFADDVKETAQELSSDGKNVAIIAHLTWIGWIVALVMNNGNKSEFGSFYVRQMLGFLLLGFLVPVPFLGWILGLVLIAAWIMSFLSALQGEMKPSFLLGKQFQDWFKSL